MRSVPQILLDTNVILDALLKRDPWWEAADRIWVATDEERIKVYLSASSLTDLFYVAKKFTNFQRAHQAVQICLEAFEIATVDRFILEQALELPGNDYEDNVQIACARFLRLDAIVTRDRDGFREAPISIWSPEDCIRHIT